MNYKINTQIYKLMNFIGFTRKFFPDNDYTVYSYRDWFEVIHQHHNLRWVLISGKWFTFAWELWDDLHYYKLGLDAVVNMDSKETLSISAYILKGKISFSIGNDFPYPFEDTFLY